MVKKGKSGGSVSSSGSKKRKKKGKNIIKDTIPTELSLPPITSVKCATLQSTIFSQDLRSMERLVVHYDYGKALTEVDANGSTLIHLAVKRRDNAMLQRLLQYLQIPLDARELLQLGGHTALHHACIMNNHQAVALLLQAGASPNLKSLNANGETALMICCKLGLIECGRALIAHGASLEIRDNFGNNASFWANKHHQDLLIRELNLPPVHTATADEFLKLMIQRNPKFALPDLNKGKKKKKGDKKKKK
jgi:hypothetical protein